MNPESFLHKKLPELQRSPEVQDAVEKHDRLSGEATQNTAEARLGTYIDRLENIFLNPDPRTRERNIEMLKPVIEEHFVVKRENVPESFFELQQRVARERGQAIEIIPENARRQMIDVIIEDQKASLDGWIDYLSSDDAVYPAWFKYFAFRNIAKLSQFDKELGKFKERTTKTTAPFPDIYREALAQVSDAYEKAIEDKNVLNDPEKRAFLDQKFATQYAEAIQKTLEHSREDREQIKGMWVKYEQGNNAAARKLYESLQGKGTGWCTAGESTARTQIESGDFHVFYSDDAQGNPTNPRLAIRMNGTDAIGEIRGVLPHQEVEPLLQDTLDEKLGEFGLEAEKYKKKSADMRRLTAIEKATNEGATLTRDNLRFLYELDAPIEGFGYEPDPRIEELRRTRNQKEDLPILFDCTPDQIAYGKNDITEDTKVYIGAWTPDIMHLLPDGVTDIYEQFPDKKVFMRTVETDPTIRNADDAIRKLEAEGYRVGDWAKDMLKKVMWSGEKRSFDLVSFSVKALGFPGNATYADICTKAEALGLDLVPEELGSAIRRAYPDQPSGEYFRVAMNPITDADGCPSLWNVYHVDDDRWLNDVNGRAGNEWFPDDRFVFLRRKSLAV